MCSGPTTTATPATGAPRGRPRTSQAATVTRGWARTRRTFHVPSVVVTTSASPSSAAHTGVGRAVPSRRYVVSSTYSLPARSASEVASTGSGTASA